MTLSVALLFSIIWVLLWAVSFIVFLTDYKSEYHRWLSLFTFLAGSGGLAVVIRQFIVPYSIEYLGINIPPVGGIVSSFSHYLAPYALLIFAIINLGLFKNQWDKWRSIVKIILLLPPFISYLLFPVYPEFQPSFRILSFWAVGYIMVANLLFIYSCMTVQHPKQKRNQFLTCILFVPALIFVAHSNYIFPAINVQNIWIHNSWIVIILFILFIIFGWKYGVLGVRIKFEKHSLDNTMRAITSGTAILNHTIKNEIMKISICMNELKEKAFKSNLSAHECYDAVSHSTKHILDMVTRINRTMQDIIIKEMPCNLAEMIEQSVQEMSPFFEKNNVKVSKNIKKDTFLICDRVHIQETINNILKNAVEAIHSDGEIHIEVTQQSKYMTLIIKDTGKGISKDILPNIFDPFYSTKNRDSNFGLGLTYCYNVMQKSGGFLEIDSKENVGTTVYLHFPMKKVLDKHFVAKREEVTVNG